MNLNPYVALIILFQFAVIAFDYVVTVLYLSMLNIGRTLPLPFQKRQRTVISEALVCADEAGT